VLLVLPLLLVLLMPSLLPLVVFDAAQTTT